MAAKGNIRLASFLKSDEGISPLPGWIFELSAEVISGLFHELGLEICEVGVKHENLAAADKVGAPAGASSPGCLRTTSLRIFAAPGRILLVDQIGHRVSNTIAHPATHPKELTESAKNLAELVDERFPPDKASMLPLRRPTLLGSEHPAKEHHA
jgi:hypothetical protein